jgi:hypothetical protein
MVKLGLTPLTYSGRRYRDLQTSSSSWLMISAMPTCRAKKKRDHLTPAGRKRLSDMMKKRWAEKRKKGAKGR